jgi:signal transduction histidine kinase
VAPALRAARADRIVTRVGPTGPNDARAALAYASDLISAATRKDVAAAFATAGVRAAGASGASLHVLRNGALRLLAASGPPDDTVVQCRVLPLSATTLSTEAFRAREPLWLGSAEAIEARFPHMRDPRAATGIQACAAIPLVADGQTIGVASFQFADPQAFDGAQTTLLGDIAAATAAALHRAARGDHETEVRAFQHRLIGIAGHELRNPLTVVLSASEQLARAATGERDKRAAARVLRNARRMERVVRDLMDYAQAQADGRLLIAPRQVDFHDVCVRVLASLSSLHPERPVSYQRGEDGRGSWDPDRLEALLENLIVNALKHGAADRPVYVGWYGDATELVLKVHNHGVPIPPSLLPHIFDPFQRGEQHAVRDSLGLGLFIVKQIVAAHGGAIQVRSDRESGTTFVVRLPYTAPAAHTRDAAG